MDSARSGSAAALLVGGNGTTATGARPMRSRLAALAAFRDSVSWLGLLTAGIAAVLVLAFLDPVAYRSPSLRATAETVMTLVALTGAWLVRAQVAHTRRLRDLLLMGALLTFALIELFILAVPAALDNDSGLGFTAALPVGQLVVAAMLAAAAFTPPGKLIQGGRRPVVAIAVLAAVAVVVAELAGLLLGTQLLAGAAYSGAGIKLVLHHPLALIVLVGTVGLFAYAAREFARRARVEAGGVLSLLAGAALLLAAAPLYFLTLPSVLPNVVTLREGFWVLAFGLILAAALRQDREIRETETRAAALAERRRVAEDLHDGLAQDLAYITAYGRTISEEFGADHPVAMAARRALALSRGTITALSDMSATPPGEALEAIAHELRDRYAIAITVDAHPEAELAPVAREPVARIAREAIANAARHGRAQHVAVSLEPTGTGVALRIRDDGCGIAGAGAAGASEGFGLRNMRERADALGGHLTVRRRKAGGTELELVLL